MVTFPHVIRNKGKYSVEKPPDDCPIKSMPTAILHTFKGFCGKNGNYFRNPQLAKVQRISQWDAQTQMGYLWHTHLSKACGPSQKMGEKEYKSQTSGRTRAKECLLDMTGHCAQEITEAMHKFKPVNTQHGGCSKS